MSTQRVRRMLNFIWGNVRSGAESIREARAFVARIYSLSRMEREFLDLALRDRKHLDELCSSFPPEEVCDEPIPRLPVGTMGPCGLVRPSREEPRVSVG
ncbi:MAG: hypothetical protein ACYS9X_03975 [Planctomycetota bacterium]